MHTPIRRAIAYLCFTLVTAAPVQAQSPKTAADTARAARESPLFRAEFPAAQAQQRGLATVTLDNGMQLNVAHYLQTSSLRAQAGTQKLFVPATQARYLRAAPEYKETVTQLTDRLVVHRRLTVSLKPGVCAQKNLPPDVAGHCFVAKPGRLAPETQVALQRIREKLNQAPASKIVRDGVTAGEARTFDDARLLDLALNQGEREVQLVSVIPTQLSDADFKPRVLQRQQEGLRFVAPLPRPAPGKVEAPAPAVPPHAIGLKQVSPATAQFPPRYFLTGFTIGREFSDKYEYTFANESWWHDRYYLQLSYHFGAGFGLRFPFSVAVKAENAGGAARRNISLSVAPVNVNSAGEPAYPLVGLDRGKYFKGKEFVLEVSAGCRFYASIPGPNVNLNCPSIDERQSRDIDPVIGAARTKLGDLWLRGEATGLGISAWVGKAVIDLGVGADVTDGRIGLHVAALPDSELQGLGSPDLVLASTSPVRFSVGPRAGAAPFGFVVDRPRYHFRVTIYPEIQARVSVDLGVYEFKETIGPYRIDSLSVAAGFQMPHHAGTVSSHRYEFGANKLVTPVAPVRR